MDGTGPKAQKRARVLRAVAAALTRDPTQSYQMLAEAAAVSRRTLYRIAATRERLIAQIQAEAIAANDAAMARAGLDDRPFRDALETLTGDFVRDADIHAFWYADTWGRPSDMIHRSASDAASQDYRARMTAFLTRGQAEAVLRADMSPTWLLAIYDGLLLAAAGSLRSDGAAPADLPRLIVEGFLHGAAVPR